MWTAADAASHGHDAGAGSGRNGSARIAITPQAAAIANVSRSLSTLDLTSAFHEACSSAPPSTARVTGSDNSVIADR